MLDHGAVRRDASRRRLARIRPGATATRTAAPISPGAAVGRLRSIWSSARRMASGTSESQWNGTAAGGA